MDLKSDVDEFRFALREDMRKELNEFREEINQKMKEFSGDLQATTVRVTEMEQRIADTEEWNEVADDALLDVLEKQRDADKVNRFGSSLQMEQPPHIWNPRGN